MARILKFHGRKALAEGKPTFYRMNYPETGERFAISVGEETAYKVEMTRAEAIAFAADVASHITFDASKGTVDRRTHADKLLALAARLIERSAG